jgi:hypothetical protein
VNTAWAEVAGRVLLDVGEGDAEIRSIADDGRYLLAGLRRDDDAHVGDAASASALMP